MRTLHDRLSDKLRSIQQEHILAYWESLDTNAQHSLARQIEQLDIPAFRMQRSLLGVSPDSTALSLSPFLPSASAGSRQNAEQGRALLANGKAGCLVVAGGQGTRLRFDGPKGMYPISPVKQKTLFQLLAEKILAAGRQAGRDLPLAIMTSPLNHEATVRFFSGHNNFGLKEEQLSFFTQKMLPFLTPQGNLFLESPESIACGPDGNGGSLQQFYESGIWKKWSANGVEHVHYVLIDNPLCDPMDAELLGYHALCRADVTVKCILRENPSEQVGVLVRKNGHVEVIEYSEIPDEERMALSGEGKLKHPCANISTFCFAMAFIEKAALHGLPLHKAFKAAKKEISQGQFGLSAEPCAWKFEKFIFDVLPMAQKVEGLLYDREKCYAPLKNLQGSGSPDSVQKALIAKDRQTLLELTGQDPGNRLLEISQDFYYPTPFLINMWKERQLPLPCDLYIDALLH